MKIFPKGIETPIGISCTYQSGRVGKKDNSELTESENERILIMRFVNILFLFMGIEIDLKINTGGGMATITQFDKKTKGQPEQSVFMRRFNYICALIVSPMACLCALVFVPILFISSFICWMAWVIFATLSGNDNPSFEIKLK